MSSSSTTTPSPTTPGTPTSTGAGALPTPTGMHGSDCPQSNGTVFTVPGSTKSFLRLCGVDYGGQGEATDLAETMAGSMDACMADCAGFPGCTACGWGYIDGDAGSAYRCWLKTNLVKSHRARYDWCFAVLQ